MFIEWRMAEYPSICCMESSREVQYLRAAPDCASNDPVKETWNVLLWTRSYEKVSLFFRTPGELLSRAAPSRLNNTTSTVWSGKQSPGSPALQTRWLRLTPAASAVKTPISESGQHRYYEADIKGMLCFLVDNVYVVFGDQVFQQSVCTPMCTNCAPFLTDLFLY
jgi:hypothetical protein